MTELPDLSRLSREEKDALILALWTQVQVLTARVAELQAQLGSPPKTPDNSSLPPSRGEKPNRVEKARRSGPRQGSLGRTGGGRALTALPDEVVTARPVRVRALPCGPEPGCCMDLPGGAWSRSSVRRPSLI